MGNAIAIAKILGPLFAVVGVGLLVNKEYYTSIFGSFTKGSALCYFGGVSALAVGLLIVQLYNVWASNWTLMITLIGWISILKGVILLLYPDSMIKMAEKMIKSPKYLTFHAAFAIVFGAVMSGFAYLA